MLKKRWMVKLKYRKYLFVSNWREYNMLWLGLEVIIADIHYQKPNITETAIN
jgi:hypothetical protein